MAVDVKKIIKEIAAKGSRTEAVRSLALTSSAMKAALEVSLTMKDPDLVEMLATKFLNCYLAGVCVKLDLPEPK